MKTRFKKALCLLLVFVIVSLSACAQNPNGDIIKNKDDGAFDAHTAISASEHNAPDATQPVNHSEEFFSTDNTVKFILNINTTLSAADMPIVEVKTHNLTGEDVERIASVLFGKSEFYYAEPMFAPIYSKAEIQEKISRWSGYTNQNAVNSLYGNHRDGTVELVQAFIEQYTKLYEKAPDENPHSVCQWEFKKESYYYESADVADSLDTSNENDVIQATVKNGDIHYLISAARRDGTDFKLNNISVYLYDGLGPDAIDEMIFKAKICRVSEPSEEQINIVKEHAEDMLEQMNLGQWYVDECYLETIYYGDVAEYIIHVNAVPVLEGIPAIRREQLDNRKSEETYASNYYLTDVQFQFAPNGELVSFEMTSPIDIKDVVNDNVAVMSMDELLQTAKTYLVHSDYYAYQSAFLVDSVKDEVGCTVDICGLEYNLTRVKVPNTDESYYYIPGITLKGTIEYYSKSSGDVYFKSEEAEILLVLNGVDVTLINTTNS